MSVDAASKAFAVLRAARVSGTTPPAWALSVTVRVALPSRSRALVLLPVSRVTHMPVRNAFHTATRGATGWPALTLCPSCDPDGRHIDDEGTCAVACGGAACAFVHADARGAPVFEPHEAATAASGAYERFAPGLRVTVVLPGHATAVVPSERLLRTRAFVGLRRAVGGCEHFVSRGFCDRGAACTFAHPLALPQWPCESPEAATRITPTPTSAVSGSRADGADASHLLSHRGSRRGTDAASVVSTDVVAGAPLKGTSPAVPTEGPTAAQRRVRHYPYDAVPQCRMPAR